MTYIIRLAAGVVAVATTVGSIAATAVPARAEHGHNAAAAAAGILGGVAAGALAAGAYGQPAYPAYDYPPPPPAYGCGFTRQPVYDGYGNFAGYRRVPAC